MADEQDFRRELTEVRVSSDLHYKELERRISQMEREQKEFAKEVRDKQSGFAKEIWDKFESFSASVSATVNDCYNKICAQDKEIGLRTGQNKATLHVILTVVGLIIGYLIRGMF
jgi:hypothetical protein